jgi:uncharacterized protein YbaR (Trm112 family)
MALSKELLEILACPQCHGPVLLTPDGSGLTCSACRLLFRVENDIPIMLLDQAKPLER